MLAEIPHVDGWIFAGLTALSFFTAAFGVVAGLGGGVLMLAVMATIFPPAALIPLHGTIQFGTNISRIIIMRKRILTHAIPPFAVGALIGGFAGGNLVVSLPSAILQMILGGFLLYVCWVPKIVAGTPDRGRFLLLGGVGMFLSMFVGATGTLLSPFVAGVSPDRRDFVATHAALMAMVHGLKIVIFGILGFAFAAYLPLLAAMIASGFFGNWFGAHMLDRMPERLFRRIFQVMLTLLALRLLYAGASELWGF